MCSTNSLKPLNYYKYYIEITKVRIIFITLLPLMKCSNLYNTR